jgi:uncharacterized protein HemX
MAALKVNPDNSITLPFPLLAILVTLGIAIAGWGASIRNDVATSKQQISELQNWKAEHSKKAEDLTKEIKESIAETNNRVATGNAQNSKDNAALQETLTNVRIQLASRH